MSSLRRRTFAADRGRKPTRLLGDRGVFFVSGLAEQVLGGLVGKPFDEVSLAGDRLATPFVDFPHDFAQGLAELRSVRQDIDGVLGSHSSQRPKTAADLDSEVVWFRGDLMEDH